jgi:ATP-dependent RNA helicase RhlE
VFLTGITQVAGKADIVFKDFDLGPDIQRGIAAAGFTEPRPIQADAIPAALKGRDILGLAQTGTGKTAAFALPILERLTKSRQPGPRALILAPTRELAAQISEETRMLAQFTRVQIATVFGGVSAHSQKQALRREPDIVVACPGRLLDLMQQRAVNLTRIDMLVLDEADHMFDMGFLPDIRRILASLPSKRQNLLFSATMPQEIRGLADRQLNNPVVVDLGNSRPVATIEHAVYPVEDSKKIDLLRAVLQDKKFVSAIVFTRTKHRAKRLAQQLEKAGYNAVALQGNMSQNQRERAMQGFRDHTFDILVATDIAARGIDVEQVSHVISFDMPNTPDAYTHRIGRTGRSERQGQAFTFVTHDDHQMIRQVERRIGAPIPRRTIEGVPGLPFDTTRAARPPQGRRPSGNPRNKPSSSRPRRGGPGRPQSSRSGGGSSTGASTGQIREYSGPNAGSQGSQGSQGSGTASGGGAGQARPEGTSRRRRRRPVRQAS